MRPFRQTLVSDRYLLDLVDKSDIAAITSHLSSKYNINDITDEQELSDLFSIVFSPLLSRACRTLDIDLYSQIDHYLFSNYIVKKESIDWFKKAFWDVNSFGLEIARKLRGKLIPRAQPDSRFKSLLFILKGPFKLAHSQVLKNFFKGLTDDQLTNTKITLLLLDSPAVSIPHVKCISFHNHPLASDKIHNFILLTSQQYFSNIIWVACIQNISLYLGLSRSSLTTYWTMKRHSIVFPEVNRYATYLSKYKNTEHDGAFWFAGRTCLEVSPSKSSRSSIIASRPSLLPLLNNNEAIVLGSLARSQKYHELEYWEAVSHLLSINQNIYFLFGYSKTPPLPQYILNYISRHLIPTQRIINVGWLGGNSADIASLIDVYLDTIPFGTGVPAVESILCGAAYITTTSAINDEASIINLLLEHPDQAHKRVDSDPSVGVCSCFSHSVLLAEKLLKSKDLRHSLNKVQSRILSYHISNSKYFTSDYLEYFTNS